MAARPRLLISDEAMAGLSGSEVDEVLQILFTLNEAGITIIMIEHIMQAVMRFSQRVVCLDAGKIICEGTPQIDRAEPRSAEGLPWRLSSSDLAASTRATARCARCTGCRSTLTQGADRRAARHQRQRQEHADEVRHGHGAADARRP